jgi:hypothetical protein
VVALSKLEIQGPGLTEAALEGGCELELTVVDTGKGFRAGLLTQDTLEWDDYLPDFLTTYAGGLAFVDRSNDASTDVLPMLRLAGVVADDSDADDDDDDDPPVRVMLAFLVGGALADCLMSALGGHHDRLIVSGQVMACDYCESEFLNLDDSYGGEDLVEEALTSQPGGVGVGAARGAWGGGLRVALAGAGANLTSPRPVRGEGGSGGPEIVCSLRAVPALEGVSHIASYLPLESWCRVEHCGLCVSLCRRVGS